jgi:ABC-2 type transport system permease protein
MSIRRIAVLLGKELVWGPKNFLFIFALVVPLVFTLLLNLLSGTFFSGKPTLGIAGGSAAVIAQAEANQALLVRVYADEASLREATAVGTVDMGLLLPPDFDTRLAQDETTAVTIFVWGESLLRDRITLATAIVGLSRELSGQEAPLLITEVTVGEGESMPWDERLLPFIVLMAIIFGGIMVPAASLVEEKQKRTLTAVITTTASLGELFTAKGLLGILLSLFMGALILLINRAFGSQPLLLVSLLTLAAIMAAVFGVLLGAFTKDLTNLFATMKAIGLLLYAPAFLYIFPGIPEWIGRIFPTYYIIAPIMTISLFDGRWADIQTDVFILVLLILLLLGLTAGVVYRARRQPTMLPGLS